MNPATLRPFVLQRARQPFAWGLRDCFLLASDAALAATGRDPAAQLRGRYFSATAAARLFRRLGQWQGLAALCFGPTVHPQAAADGDAVLLPAADAAARFFDHRAMGFMWRGLVVCQGAQGLVFQPRAHALAAWRVAP